MAAWIEPWQTVQFQLSKPDNKTCTRTAYNQEYRRDVLMFSWYNSAARYANEGNPNFRRPKRLFFCRTNAKVFSKHPQDCFYLSCMHATLRQPWLTNNKCTHLQVALYRNRSMASQRVYTNFKTSFQKLPSSIACCATLNCLYKLVKVKI